MRPPCSICGKPTVAFGYCDNHYRRFKRHGDPLKGRQIGLPAAERFATKYVIDQFTGCWVWQRGLTPDGYGGFYVGSMIDPRGNRRRVHARAHRWAYEHYVGAIPPGHEVCHRCDNPSCVNPEHLFIGTHTDNMRDSAVKGRMKFPGEANGRAKITRSDVAAIRAAYVGRYGQLSELARLYGLTSATVSKIVKRQTWADD